MLIILLLALISFFSRVSLASGPTSIWIDKVPSYSSLAPCAEDRLSAIVRAQSYGCGDNMQLTSFSCFCTDSSSSMNSIISTAIESNCMNPTFALSRSTIVDNTADALAQVNRALDVFHSYCLQTTGFLASSSASATPITTPSPSSQAASVATTSPPQTSTPAASTSYSSPSPLSTGAKIAIGIAVPLGTLALILPLGFLLYRRRHNSKTPAEAGGEIPEISGDSPVERRELKGDNSEKYAHELDPGQLVLEMDAGADAKASPRELDASEVRRGKGKQ